MNLSKEQALARMNAALAELEAVTKAGRFSDEFALWQRNTKTALKKIFGTSSNEAIVCESLVLSREHCTREPEDCIRGGLPHGQNFAEGRISHHRGFP
jgi:hypothetical protein